MPLAAIADIVAMLLRLLTGLLVKSPEEKAEDKVADRIKLRAKQILEKEQAREKFKKGSTDSLERAINRLFKL